MVQILWKDGIEPPDLPGKKRGSESIATYTGKVEEETVAKEAEQNGDEPKPKPEQKAAASEQSIGEMIERIRENLAEQMQQGRARPVGGPVVHKPGRQQQSQVGEDAKMTARNYAATQWKPPTIAEMYYLKRRSEETNGQPLTIASECASASVMTPLILGSSAVPELVIGIKVEEPRKKAAVPIAFPLSDEQRKREEFYQQTGMTPAELRELLEPGWTLAGALDPRENARRIRTGFWNRVYDVEFTMAKAKHTVHDFLFKKRPVPEKALASGKT